MEYLIHLLKKIRVKGSFLYNLSFAAGSSIGIFFLQIVFSPILSRIFEPTAYGHLATFNLIVSYGITIVGLGLNEALVIAGNKRDYITLSQVIITLVAFFFLILSLGLVFSPSLLKSIVKPGILFYSLVCIFLLTLNTILQSYLLREGGFKTNSLADFTSQSVGKVFSLIHGVVIGPLGNGLILGAILVPLCSFVLRIRNQTLILLRLIFLKWPSHRDLIELFAKYKRYPTYIFPSSLMLGLSYQLPVLVILIFYSREELGLFFFAQNLLHMPMNAIGNSLKHTYFNKVWNLKKDQKQVQLSFLRLQKHLILISVPGLIIFIVFGEMFFAFYFGSQWRESGLIATLLSVSYFVQFMTSPFGSLRRIFGKERGEFLIQMMLLILRSCTLLFILVFDPDFITAIVFYAVVNALGYLVAYFDLFRILNLRFSKIEFGILILVIVSVSFAFFIKFRLV